MRVRALCSQVAINAVAIALVASPALAQTATAGADSGPSIDKTAPAPDEIVVTGSRIRHNPLDEKSPVTFLDSADIARTGLVNVADALQRLPSMGGGLNSRANSSGNFGNPPDGSGVGAGSATINLRYLGSQRTLVLVDGLRFTNGSSASGIPGSVDINAIPQAAIERIEILQDGASSIYGSDAIAGVVNIITKKKQNGFAGTAENGIYGQGDGFTQKYDLSYGFNREASGTHVVLGASYTKQDPVPGGDRASSRFPTPFATACDSRCSSYTPNGRFLVLGQNLTLKAPVAGRPVYDPLNPTGATSDFKTFTTADRYNTRPEQFLLTPFELIGAFVNLDQDLASSIKFSGKLFYNHRKSENQAPALPLAVGQSAGTGSTYLDNMVISATNPYNPFGVTLDNSNYSVIYRRLVEGGDRRYYQTVNSYYGSGTLSGKFDFLAGSWYWDANGVYGHNNARQTAYGNINAQKLAQALGPVANCTGSCVPFNIFGGAGSVTPAMYNYIAFVQRDASSQSLWDGSANLTGPIFNLPAGPMSVALGYEHRDQRGAFSPDATVAAGLGSDIPAIPSRGHIKSDEVYGELSVPVLKDLPLVKALNGSFAARYSSFQPGGSATTLKGGADWTPTRDLMFRGSYAQGFRAPTIGELFGTPSRFDQTVDDPCASNSAANTAAVRANCSARGVPTTYVQESTKPVTTGGNTALKAEKSRSFVVGGVYNARWAADAGFARSMTLEVNYSQIKVNNAIQATGADVLLNRCAVLNDASSCAAITRSAIGTVTSINGLLQNIASIQTSAVDANFNYRSPTGKLGSFGIFWANTFLLNYVQSYPSSNGDTVIHREGTEQGAPDQAYPRYKSTATFDWTFGSFDAALTGRYISSVTESQFANHELGRRLYGDIQLTWNTKSSGRDFAFTVGVNNIAGTVAPGCYSCSLGNYDETTYDIPGRYLYVRVGVKM